MCSAACRPSPSKVPSADGFIATQPTLVNPCLVNVHIFTDLVRSPKVLRSGRDSTFKRLQGAQCSYGTYINYVTYQASIQVFTSTYGSHDVFHVLTDPKYNRGETLQKLTTAQLNQLRSSGVNDAVWYLGNHPADANSPVQLAMDVHGTMIVILLDTVATIRWQDFVNLGGVAATSLKSEQRGLYS